MVVVIIVLRDFQRGLESRFRRAFDNDFTNFEFLEFWKAPIGVKIWKMRLTIPNISISDDGNKLENIVKLKNLSFFDDVGEVFKEV